MSFRGMLSVLFNINQIIDEIDTARDQAKEQKSQTGAEKGVGVEQLQIKYQCGKDKDVFCPLLGSHRFQ